MAGIRIANPIGHTREFSFSNAISFLSGTKQQETLHVRRPTNITPQDPANTRSGRFRDFDRIQKPARTASITAYLEDVKEYASFRHLNDEIKIQRTNSKSKVDRIRNQLHAEFGPQIAAHHFLNREFRTKLHPFVQAKFQELFFNAIGKTASASKILGSLAIMRPLNNLSVVTAPLPRFTTYQVGSQEGRFKICILLGKEIDQTRSLSIRDSYKKSLSHRFTNTLTDQKISQEDRSAADLPDVFLKIEKKINNKMEVRRFNSDKDAELYLQRQISKEFFKNQASDALITHIAAPVIIGILGIKYLANIIKFNAQQSKIVSRYTILTPTHTCNLQQHDTHNDTHNDTYTIDLKKIIQEYANQNGFIKNLLSHIETQEKTNQMLTAQIKELQKHVQQNPTHSKEVQNEDLNNYPFFFMDKDQTDSVQSTTTAVPKIEVTTPENKIRALSSISEEVLFHDLAEFGREYGGASNKNSPWNS